MPSLEHTASIVPSSDKAIHFCQVVAWGLLWWFVAIDPPLWTSNHQWFHLYAVIIGIIIIIVYYFSRADDNDKQLSFPTILRHDIMPSINQDLFYLHVEKNLDCLRCQSLPGWQEDIFVNLNNNWQHVSFWPDSKPVPPLTMQCTSEIKESWGVLDFSKSSKTFNYVWAESHLLTKKRNFHQNWYHLLFVHSHLLGIHELGGRHPYKPPQQQESVLSIGNE